MIYVQSRSYRRQWLLVGVVLVLLLLSFRQTLLRDNSVLSYVRSQKTILGNGGDGSSTAGFRPDVDLGKETLVIQNDIHLAKNVFLKSEKAETVITPQAKEGDVPKYKLDEVVPIKHIRPEDLKNLTSQLTKWSASGSVDHWPSYESYRQKSYDPNRWEGLDWELDFYLKNGVNDLRDKGLNPAPYVPYPNYKSSDGSRKGEVVSCQSARGLDLNKSLDDFIRVYQDATLKLPLADVGSASILGTSDDICLDRYNRLGFFGYGQHVIKPVNGWTSPKSQPSWEEQRWGQLENQCFELNRHRYRALAAPRTNSTRSRPVSADLNQVESIESAGEEDHADQSNYHHRNALLIRVASDHKYSENDMHVIRALITELSLHSGAEYKVFILISLKDAIIDIYNSASAQEGLLNQVVPPELRDVSIIWTDKLCKEWYPNVKKCNDLHWHQHLPLQWFSKLQPEFEYIWSWDINTRYTGNHYEFLEKTAGFARSMPRKNLWERNSRFYFTREYGNFASFLADTDAAVTNATTEGHVKPIWGPQPYHSEIVSVMGPVPPLSYEEDKFEWGVDVEADLITFSPIWNPEDTQWPHRDQVFDSTKSKFTSDDVHRIPRRTTFSPVMRFSKTLLHAMHLENRAGFTMHPDMWPATIAFHHGLKAVYAPHPIWLDRKWPIWLLDATFNAEGNKSASWAQGDDSPYNPDREAQFNGWSWSRKGDFAERLYRRWLGLNARDILGNVGDKAFEEGKLDVADDVYELFDEEMAKAENKRKTKDDVHVSIGGQGRICLPPMLLYPVKNVGRDCVESKNGVLRGSEEDRKFMSVLTSQAETVKEQRGFSWTI